MNNQDLRLEISNIENLPKLPSLRMAVVGHVEWVTFVGLDNLPQPGTVGHANWTKEEPAGAGAVIAVTMSKLLSTPVDFFTALGKDEIGEKSNQRLKQLGVKTHVAWVDQPTRRGISFVDQHGDRAITVIGDRLEPKSTDKLPWEIFSNINGVFVTATDSKGLENCRKASVLLATPRLTVAVIEKSKIQLDCLIGSAYDQNEKVDTNQLSKKPKLVIKTEADEGCRVMPDKRYKAVRLSEPVIDTYGCGDTFAAAFSLALTAEWDIHQAISYAAHYGAHCALIKGPYDVG